MARVGFEWLVTTLAALRGIEPYEVTQALAAQRRWPRPATGPQGLAVVTVWARTVAGRPLIVVVRQADGHNWWILGARDMSPAETREYEEWEARS